MPTEDEQSLPPQFHRSTWHPELYVFEAATRAGDWTAIAGAFAQLRHPGAVSLAVRIASDIPGADQFLRQVVAREPSALGGTLLGASLVQVGWRARTSYAASRVSRDQFAAFHHHLREAEQTLMDVTARDPSAVSAWEYRLLTARGLELGQAEALRRYARLSRTDPHHYGSQLCMIQQLCPKWGGSWEALYQFAREQAAAAPPGSLSGALVPQAHLERWTTMDDNEVRAYLQSAAAEVWAAAQRSVLNPQFRLEPRWVTAVNAFAVFFGLLGDQRSTAPFFRLMGDFACDVYWDHLGDPAEKFYEFRTWALAEGGGQ
ncbi:hypothetical protein [Cryptosporangium aurantiacum]|uniref:DUF4034 domain-containing protein n=1 Tax=Cryptosporangium aurantiacum TaxID=134849 RepID=A0A1M7JWW9_9ACTN|nr:hypothetical protein [Cryptosporangium aurantiacum]SHM57570.1 hypothetical protein SAMN05443668_101933 [Cryptosporangium aurantiacum]